MYFAIATTKIALLEALQSKRSTRGDENRTAITENTVV